MRSTYGQSVMSGQLQERDGKDNPSTTKKFVAYVEHRRKDMEDKKLNEEMKF